MIGILKFVYFANFVHISVTNQRGLWLEKANQKHGPLFHIFQEKYQVDFLVVLNDENTIDQTSHVLWILFSLNSSKQQVGGSRSERSKRAAHRPRAHILSAERAEEAEWDRGSSPHTHQPVQRPGSQTQSTASSTSASWTPETQHRINRYNISSNDRPFDCPIIYTDKNTQWCFDHGLLNNTWHTNAHFLMGTPCLMIITSKERDNGISSCF